MQVDVCSCVTRNVILSLTMNTWVTQHFGCQTEYCGTSSLFKDVWGGIKPFKDNVKTKESHAIINQNQVTGTLPTVLASILGYRKKMHCAVPISMFCNHMLHFHCMKMYLQVDFVYCPLLKFTIMFLLKRPQHVLEQLQLLNKAFGCSTGACNKLWNNLKVL